jgi:hypothetical protein
MCLTTIKNLDYRSKKEPDYRLALKIAQRAHT